MKKRADGRYVETITDPITKKRKFLYGKSPTEVKRKLALHLYIPSENCGALFAEVAEEWQEEHYKEIEYGTQVSYTPAFKRSLEFFEDILVKNITPVDIRNFVTMIAKKGFSHQTVKIHFLVVKLILDHAIYIEEITTNPAEIIKLPKGLPKQERDMPSDQYIKIIRDNADSSQMGLFAYFLLYSGLRKGEALALQWRDIDFEMKTITVNKVSEFHNNQPRIKNYTKTKSSTRDVILLDKLIDKIMPLHLHSQRPLDEFVFTGNNGLMTRSEFTKRWRRYCIDTGMCIPSNGTLPVKNNLTPHQLRHAFVTMLYEAGIDAENAMLMTGHTNISTMRDIYTHIRDKKTDEMSIKLNKFDW